MIKPDLAEKILFKFCYEPSEVSVKFSEDVPESDELRHIQSEVESLRPFIERKRVVDFGSGYGHQALALRAKFGCRVLGLEIEDKKIEYSTIKAKEQGFAPEEVRFSKVASSEDRGGFDLVLSLNSFEHFNDPDHILTEMRKLLRPDGKMLISFGPPWYAPYGSHMNYFCKIPWVNLLFSEKTIMNVRKSFREDGASKYEEVPGGLARMSVGRFEKLIREHGLRPVYKSYRAVKGVEFLCGIPLIRELFINKVTVILEKA